MSIEINRIEKYWNERSAKQGARTVGFSNAPIGQQDKRYETRKKFILDFFSYEDIKSNVLEFGCGTGRYAPEFANYIGVDITKTLYEIAIKNNPDKDIRLIELHEDLSGIIVDTVFTATVLQHNSDESLERIFENMPNADNYYFYENSHVTNINCKGRIGEDYFNILSKYKKVKIIKEASHIIHGENHNITLFKRY